MSPYFVIRPSKDGNYYFTLEAENNEIVLTSETYYLKTSATNGIDSVKVNSQNDTCFKRKISTRGFRYFVLVAANGEPIGTSEEYSSSYAMEIGIASIKRIAPTAGTLDMAK